MVRSMFDGVTPTPSEAGSSVRDSETPGPSEPDTDNESEYTESESETESHLDVDSIMNDYESTFSTLKEFIDIMP
jgi:hypothetical protein